MHRYLMRCHLAMGNRPGALLQYEECAALLRRELDIEPMSETTALHDAIRRGEATAGPAPGGVLPEERPVSEILSDLRAAAGHIERARSALDAQARPHWTRPPRRS
jgi:hypothetical protein